MPEKIHYHHCPACQSADIQYSLAAKDHTVSGEDFTIWECGNCSLRFTQDVPDQSGIGRYYASEEYVSHTDTKEGLVNRLYHLVRNHTLQTKQKLVQTRSGKRMGALLDVGAGTGAFSDTMQRAGWSVTGLEPDATARKNAREKYGLSLLSPEELYHLPPSQFDAITLWHVLEHVHDLQGYLEKFHRVLKPGGKLIIAVPNYTSYDARVYGEYWAAYDVPRHLYHFSPLSMRKLSAAKGFAMESIHPMWFDSFYVSMLSEKYRNGSGNLIGAAWNGLVSNLSAFSGTEKCSSLIYVLGKQGA
ncbi:class I SAM-dependent methyltransferase [Sediminibacterium soli]|uniref:class I SAM-dependent methyltransferase n=1 Tax=Sediminibacterium soli TaxID=2698829 RepID=UPI001379D5E7|nr:class I SAM-dependent methyltransferase [Sediminibacterium soli]NCI46183.1 class I SAM-dependent methyltransferase [Sediminibacterium soli]